MKPNKNGLRQKKGPLGVAVKGLILRGKKYLILKRSVKSSFDPGLWDLPGGKLEYGERLEDTLIREVKEETGLAIKVLSPFDTWHFFKDEIFVTGVTFLCSFVKGKLRLSSEHSDFAWIDPANYKKYHLSTAVGSQLAKYLEVAKKKKIEGE